MFLAHRIDERNEDEAKTGIKRPQERSGQACQERNAGHAPAFEKCVRLNFLKEWCGRVDFSSMGTILPGEILKWRSLSPNLQLILTASAEIADQFGGPEIAVIDSQ